MKENSEPGTVDALHIASGFVQQAWRIDGVCGSYFPAAQIEFPEKSKTSLP